ncbi:YggT family protein [Lysinibacter sp. HNR]|nr:YggT family protein [Lysinibacter sp. HNR]WGD36463.1 YggT family protein [Lysinibacter sp. HNR]
MALIIGFSLQLIIRIYIAILWARLILDWVRVLNPRWYPKGFLVVLVELVFTLTDPPIKFIRKLLPPLRLGPVALDFGWLITMIVCWILLAIIPGIIAIFL